MADLIGADLSGRLVAVPLDDPALVVGPLERDERQAELLDGLEAAHPQQVLLQRPDEALGAAVPFRLAHERRRALDAEEADFGVEVVAHVLAAVVVAEREAGGDVLGEGAEALADRPSDRLERPRTGRCGDWRGCRRTRPSSGRRRRHRAAWPSPVIAEVASVPRIGWPPPMVIRPSWALGLCGTPARWCAG